MPENREQISKCIWFPLDVGDFLMTRPVRGTRIAAPYWMTPHTFENIFRYLSHPGGASYLIECSIWILIYELYLYRLTPEHMVCPYGYVWMFLLFCRLVSELHVNFMMEQKHFLVVIHYLGTYVVVSTVFYFHPHSWGNEITTIS